MGIPFDLHTHCTLSFDGKSSADDMVRRAAELGIKHYALTDHVDLGEFADPDFDLDSTVNGAREIIPSLREEYADRVDLLYGVELGQATQESDTAERLLRENDYDFVIGSLHNIKKHKDFYFLNYEGMNIGKLLKKYFNELFDLASYCEYDVLGHITYPLRYIVGEYGADVDMSEYGGIIDDILTAAIIRGKGIEINTSGLRQKYGRMFPDTDMIVRYRELGGRIITIGSDAHCAEDLGKGIEEGIIAAKKAGFDEIAIFKHREPMFIRI